MSQLQVLLKIEQEKENELAQDLQSAQSYHQACVKKLDEVQRYKLEYLKRMQSQAGVGMQGVDYQHYQRFIVQLEDGIKQQLEVIATSKQVVDQRKGIWLEQHKKVKSVTTLLDKKHKQQLLKEEKYQQSLADEFAAQKYIRQQLLS